MAYQEPQHQYTPSPGAGLKPGFQDGLFDCTPCGSCLLGTFLPCMLLGRTSSRMKNANNPNPPPPDMTNGDCMLMCCVTYFTGCGWIFAMIKRGEIRQMYNMPGSGTEDCCTTFWCACCALIQQDKEVQIREAARRASAMGHQQAYQAQPPMGMVVPPQGQYQGQTEGQYQQ